MKFRNGGIATAAIPRYHWGLPPQILVGLRRGVVTAVHWPEDESSLHGTGLEVDVLLYDRTFVPNIPVATYVGAADNDLRVPQPSMRASGGYDVVQYNAADPASVAEWLYNMGTPVNDLDGDHVLIGFVKGRNYEPVMLGYLTHPRRMRPPTRQYEPPEAEKHHAKPTGWVRQIRHAGSVIGVDEGGNIYLDARCGGWPNDDAARKPKGPVQTVYVQGGTDGAVVIRVGAGTPGADHTKIVVTRDGGVRVDLGKKGVFKVEQGGVESTGGVAEAGATRAELEKLQSVVDSLVKWGLTAKGGSIGKYSGPQAPPPAADLSVPGLVVPQQSQE